MLRQSWTAAILVLLTMLLTTSLATADELEDQLQETKKQLESAQSTKSSTQSEIERLEAIKNQYAQTLAGLRTNYQSTQSQLTVTETTIQEKEDEIENAARELEQFEQDLAHRTSITQKNVRALYIHNHTNLLSSVLDVQEANRLGQNLLYQNAVINDLRQQIVDLNQQIVKITEIKNLLAEIKTQLEEQKTALLNDQRYLQNEINTTSTQLSVTESRKQDLHQALIGIDEQIASLTQRQKEILAAKAAAALKSTSVGNVETGPAVIERSAPQDGQVYFSFWTYGYPHRVGMNQYGAFGRSKAGQSVDEILHAYYNGVELVDWDVPTTINLTDGRTIAFEDDYLLGIGEMPSCWGSPERGGMEALKAQAIAARTYAISYTNNGASAICTNQSCQVYVGTSKVAGQCGEYWREAVESTRGRVIVHGGQPITAWYASTAGGFTLSSQEVWGGARPYVTGIADLDGSGQAYDGPGHGESPWYHKAWGNEPWLSFDQVADLVNAALLPEQYNNQLDQLATTTVRERLTEAGIEPVTDLKSIEIIDQNGNAGAGTAQTAFLRAYYQDGGMAEVTGKRFKFVYNLRSPGTNAIWTTRFDVVTAAEL